MHNLQALDTCTDPSLRGSSPQIWYLACQRTLRQVQSLPRALPNNGCLVVVSATMDGYYKVM